MHIYGVDVATTKGKTTRRKPIQINNIAETPISPTILDLHPIIHLLPGYFSMQGVSFLHSIPRGCGFRTVEHSKKYGRMCNQVEMEKGIKQCINVYHTHGLRVVQSNIDNKCTCIKESIRPVRLNLVAVE